MFRRFLWLMVLAGVLGLVPAGCDTHKFFLRHKDEDDSTKLSSIEEQDKPDKVIGGNSSDADGRAFFKKNRRAGGWSSEAQEIESHLGAN